MSLVGSPTQRGPAPRVRGALKTHTESHRRRELYHTHSGAHPRGGCWGVARGGYCSTAVQSVTLILRVLKLRRVLACVCGSTTNLPRMSCRMSCEGGSAQRNTRIWCASRSPCHLRGPPDPRLPLRTRRLSSARVGTFRRPLAFGWQTQGSSASKHGRDAVGCDAACYRETTATCHKCSEPPPRPCPSSQCQPHEGNLQEVATGASVARALCALRAPTQAPTRATRGCPCVL